MSAEDWPSGRIVPFQTCNCFIQPSVGLEEWTSHPLLQPHHRLPTRSSLCDGWQGRDWRISAWDLMYSTHLSRYSHKPTENQALFYEISEAGDSLLVPYFWHEDDPPKSYIEHSHRLWLNHPILIFIPSNCLRSNSPWVIIICLPSNYIFSTQLNDDIPGLYFMLPKYWTFEPNNIL